MTSTQSCFSNKLQKYSQQCWYQLVNRSILSHIFLFHHETIGIISQCFQFTAYFTQISPCKESPGVSLMITEMAQYPFVSMNRTTAKCWLFIHISEGKASRLCMPFSLRLNLFFFLMNSRIQVLLHCGRTNIVELPKSCGTYTSSLTRTNPLYLVLNINYWQLNFYSSFSSSEVSKMVQMSKKPIYCPYSQHYNKEQKVFYVWASTFLFRVVKIEESLKRTGRQLYVVWIQGNRPERFGNYLLYGLGQWHRY